MGRPKKNPETITLICELCKKPFTVRYAKKHQRFCSKMCSTNSPITKQKNVDNAKKTFTEKYGCHPMQTDITKENLKRSMIEKYGVGHFSQHADYNKMVKSTKLERYGDENFTNREKSKQTCLEKYGVDNISNLPYIRKKRGETKKTNHYNKLIRLCKTNNLQLLTDRNHYIGINRENVYKFKCLKCNNDFESIISYLNKIYCPNCFPENKNTKESAVYDFIRENLPCDIIVNRNDRTILSKKEIDIYVPSKKIAIEFNGLYWHGEECGGKEKSYHLNKTKICGCKGIRLIHIFENEWRDKQEIVKSILRSALNITTDIVKVYGRECEIKEIDTQTKNKFLNENHLQGEDKSKIKIGLYHNNELISLMTFKSSRFDKKIQWEMIRYCTKINTRVIGGANKLFSYFTKTYNPVSIVSYCDRRYFTGEVYKELGFVFVDHTSPNYFYIIDKHLFNRMNFQKHKLKRLLKIFDPNLSEWKNMINNGYDRIWDCGNSKWVYVNK